jgi:hypothetical protein
LDVYLNLRKSSKGILLAICDAEILGKTLCEGKIVFHVKAEFYQGRKMNIDDAIAIIPKSTSVNLIGKNIVKKAIEKGLVHPEAVLLIDGVPHAQIVKL